MIIFVHICMYTFENKRMRMQPRNFGETQNRFVKKALTRFVFRVPGGLKEEE